MEKIILFVLNTGKVGTEPLEVGGPTDASSGGGEDGELDIS